MKILQMISSLFLTKFVASNYFSISPNDSPEMISRLNDLLDEKNLSDIGSELSQNDNLQMCIINSDNSAFIKKNFNTIKSGFVDYIMAADYDKNNDKKINFISKVRKANNMAEYQEVIEKTIQSGDMLGDNDLFVLDMERAKTFFIAKNLTPTLEKDINKIIEIFDKNFGIKFDKVDICSYGNKEQGTLSIVAMDEPKYHYHHIDSDPTRYYKDSAIITSNDNKYQDLEGKVFDSLLSFIVSQDLGHTTHIFSALSYDFFRNTMSKESKEIFADASYQFKKILLAIDNKIGEVKGENSAIDIAKYDDALKFYGLIDIMLMHKLAKSKGAPGLDSEQFYLHHKDDKNFIDFAEALNGQYNKMVNALYYDSNIKVKDSKMFEKVQKMIEGEDDISKLSKNIIEWLDSNINPGEAPLNPEELLLNPGEAPLNPEVSITRLVWVLVCCYLKIRQAQQPGQQNNQEEEENNQEEQQNNQQNNQEEEQNNQEEPNTQVATPRNHIVMNLERSDDNNHQNNM